MVRVIIDNETLLFLVLNLAIYKSQLKQEARACWVCHFVSKPALRRIPHNEILNNLFPLHHLLQRRNHCSLGVLLM